MKFVIISLFLSAWPLNVGWASSENLFDPENSDKDYDSRFADPSDYVRPIYKVTNFKGRLVFSDNTNCNGESGSIYSTQDKDCIAFLRQFDAVTGAPITVSPPPKTLDNGSVLRPLSSRVELSFGYSNPSLNMPVTCPSVVVQSDLDGWFNALVPGCKIMLGPNVTLPLDTQTEITYNIVPPDIIKVRVELRYDVIGLDHPADQAPQTLGSIRALWNKANIQTIYQPKVLPIAYSSASANGTLDYVYPVFDLSYKIDESLISGKTLDMGYFSAPGSASNGITSLNDGYLHLILSHWQSVLMLHEKLRQEFLNVDQTSKYKKMFVTDFVKNCVNCYTVTFTGTGGSSGSLGMVGFLGAVPNHLFKGGLSITVGHEVTHSLHSAVAPSSIGNLADYLYSSGKIDAQGNSYGGGHTASQVQEMGLALQEGIATGIGLYLVGGCRGDWVTPYGTPFPYFAPWTPLDSSCDAASNCLYHNFRWHMTKRGIAEGSPEWAARLMKIQTAGYASTIEVTSNSEARYALFACDLLTSKTDITHTAGGIRTNVKYFDNYLSTIGQMLDGDPNIVFQWGQYKQDVAAKDFKITLIQLLVAMEKFCPSCSVGLPVVGDLSYPDERLSTHARLAPQTLGMYMVKQGWLSKEQLNNVLRANYMEEVP